MEMATKHPRLQVVLDKPLYDVVAALADQQGVSMSTKARGLIEEALEHMEDMILLSIAEERLKKPGKLLTVQEVRKRLNV